MSVSSKRHGKVTHGVKEGWIIINHNGPSNKSYRTYILNG